MCQSCFAPRRTPSSLSNDRGARNGTDPYRGYEVLYYRLDCGTAELLTYNRMTSRGASITRFSGLLVTR